MLLITFIKTYSYTVVAMLQLYQLKSLYTLGNSTICTSQMLSLVLVLVLPLIFVSNQQHCKTEPCTHHWHIGVYINCNISLCLTYFFSS